MIVGHCRQCSHSGAAFSGRYSNHTIAPRPTLLQSSIFECHAARTDTLIRSSISHKIVENDRELGWKEGWLLIPKFTDAGGAGDFQSWKNLVDLFEPALSIKECVVRDNLGYIIRSTLVKQYLKHSPRYTPSHYKLLRCRLPFDPCRLSSVMSRIVTGHASPAIRSHFKFWLVNLSATSSGLEGGYKMEAPLYPLTSRSGGIHH